MAVYLSKSADAQEYNWLIRRNARLEDVNEHQMERLDDLETRLKRLEDGLGETTRVLQNFRDDVEVLAEGFRCARCRDTGTILVGSGAPDDPYDEEDCPVCVTGTEEPEWNEDEIELDAPEEDEP